MLGGGVLDKSFLCLFTKFISIFYLFPAYFILTLGFLTSYFLQDFTCFYLDPRPCYFLINLRLKNQCYKINSIVKNLIYYISSLNNGYYLHSTAPVCLILYYSPCISTCIIAPVFLLLLQLYFYLY